MVENLNSDMKNMTNYRVEQTVARVPIKIKFTSELMNQLANAQVDLFKTIKEGNRRHNIEISEYIKNKLNKI